MHITLPHRFELPWRRCCVISALTFPRGTSGDINIAKYKPVYSKPPGSNLRNAVDGKVNTEAYMRSGSMPFISVDLGSQFMIDEVHIIIRRAGKLNRTGHIVQLDTEF